MFTNIVLSFQNIYLKNVIQTFPQDKIFTFDCVEVRKAPKKHSIWLKSVYKRSLGWIAYEIISISLNEVAKIFSLIHYIPVAF